MVGTHPPVPTWDNWYGWNFSVMPMDGAPAGQKDAWGICGVRMAFRGVDVCPQDMWDFRMGRKPLPAEEAAPPPIDPRRFMVATAAMQGLLAGGGEHGLLRSMALGEVSFWAVRYADSLLDELGKTGR